MNRELGALVGPVDGAGQVQLDRARADRSARGHMRRQPARVEHPPQPQVGDIVVRPRALDHFERGDPRIRAEHRGELRGSVAAGGIDQRGARRIEHAERPEPGDALRHRRRTLEDRAVVAAIIVDDLDGFAHHGLRHRVERRESQCHRGERADQAHDPHCARTFYPIANGKG